MKSDEGAAIDAIARQVANSIIATRRSISTHLSDVERIPQPELFGRPLTEIDELARMLVATVESASNDGLEEGYLRTAEIRNDIFCAGRRLAYSAWELAKPELLTEGLVLFAFQDDGKDPRDTMVGLARFKIQADAMEVPAEPIFERAAKASPVALIAQTIRTFGMRSDIQDGRDGWKSFRWVREGVH